MGYSSLANYKCITSHKWVGRLGYKISAIAIHHMAGNLSVQQCGKVFLNNDVSAHYGIDNNGNIGVYVDEKDSSWSMGSRVWNRKVISIELANSTGSPSWKVSDKVIEKCIDLVVDIAYRNGWTYVAYDGTLSGSDIIAHKWVASTACPGPYMINNGKLKYIAQQADKKLKAKRAADKTKKAYTGTFPTLPAREYFKSGDGGTKGTTNVKNLQKLLNWINGGSISVDGRIGPKTINAVLIAQKILGVKADGLFGKDTLAKAKAYRK